MISTFSGILRAMYMNAVEVIYTDLLRTPSGIQYWIMTAACSELYLESKCCKNEKKVPNYMQCIVLEKYVKLMYNAAVMLTYGATGRNSWFIQAFVVTRVSRVKLFSSD